MYNSEFDHADVAKLVDAPDLGSGAERCESSSLSVRTTLKMSSFRAAFFTSIPLYTPFEIETAFTAVSIVSFRRPIIYVESIAKTCRIGPYP